jgi:uncharacterized membrane protein
MTQTLAAPKKDRLIFIDVMRGIAVLWMIETHILNALIRSELRHGSLFGLLNISNGFVAVSFIFCAGCGFWLAAMRKGDEYKRFEPSLWVYLRRLGLIILLGYWLHIPVLSLRKFLGMDYNLQLIFFQSDVLHAIVISSLASLLLLLIVRKQNILPYIFLALALIVGYFTAAVKTSNPLSYMPLPIATYFAGKPVSMFPLFPWAAYFFAGAGLTHFFMKTQNKTKLALILGSICFIIMFVSFTTHEWTNYYWGLKTWWEGAPTHTIFRLSGTIGVFCTLFLLERYYKGRQIGEILRMCGQESLFIYVLHLMMVYGSVVNVGLSYLVGAQLTPIPVLLFTIAVCLLNYWIAKVWSDLKGKNIVAARYIMLSLALLFIVIFIFNNPRT